MNNIKRLLDDAHRVSRRHDKKEKETGFNFNLFSITKIERYEVNTHSAMIAELLNPKGSHGQGSVFLELFVKDIILTQKEGFKESLDYKNAIVLKEESFNGREDRVDIIVKFSEYWILIENKIDALDGNKQLERYYKVAKDEIKQFDLIYLTKFGTDPRDESLGELTLVDISKVSFKTNISDWLNLCIKEVALTPIVREAILQYLNLVKKITGTSMTTDRKSEIAELLSKNHNLTIAVEIEKSIADAKGMVLYEFFKTIENKAIDRKHNLPEDVFFEKDRLYNKNKCKQWFQQEGKHEKSIEFGVFIETDDDKVLFFVTAATRHLYYGFIPTSKATLGKKYPINLTLEDSLENNKFEGLKKQNWSNVHFYSKGIYKDIYSNVDNLLKLDNIEIKKILDALESFNNETQAASR